MQAIRIRCGSAIVSAAVVSAAMLGLTGCAAIGDLIGQGVEQSTGGNISLNGLPTSWPGDVPVIDGTISGGAQVNNGWTALVKSTSSNALNNAVDLLTPFGFVVQTNVSTNGVGVVTLISSHYTVTLTGSNDGVLYVISPVQ